MKCQIAETFDMKPWETGGIPIIWVLRYGEYLKWADRRRNA